MSAAKDSRSEGSDPETRGAREIEALRARIEALDAQVIRLLGERFVHVRRLGRCKALAQEPVEDAARESELRALYVQAALHEGLDPDFVLTLFAQVHERSKSEQRARGRRPKTA